MALTSVRSERKNNFGDTPGSELIKVALVVDRLLPLFEITSTLLGSVLTLCIYFFKSSQQSSEVGTVIVSHFTDRQTVAQRG